MQLAPVALVTAGLLATALPSPAASPSEAKEQALEQLLDRAGEYVVRYDQELGDIVGEERAHQEVRDLSATWRRHGNPILRSRDTEADYLLLRLRGIPERLGYRDVKTIDGEPVRDRVDFQALMQDLPEDPEDQWRYLAYLSSRHNIGNVGRNINTPTWALVILRPENQPRFDFDLGKEKTVDGRTARVVRFAEHHIPTLVANQYGGQMPVAGEFWLEVDSGRVLHSEVNIEKGTSSRIVVDYRYEPQIGMWVPEKMRESYRARGQRTECTSEYIGFRRFDVEVGFGVHAP